MKRVLLLHYRGTVSGLRSALRTSGCTRVPALQDEVGLRRVRRALERARVREGGCGSAA